MTVRRTATAWAVLGLATSALGQAATPAGAAGTAALAPVPGPAIAPVLLPVPAVAPGDQSFFSITGATRGGVLAGSLEQLVRLPDGTVQDRTTVVRLRRDAQGRWVRRTLPLPAGATFPYTVGIDASGAVAGGALVAGASRLVVWPAAGAPRVVGPAGVSASAVGPDGTIGLTTPIPGGFRAAGLLPPAGSVTLLASGASATVDSVGGPSLAVTITTTPGGQASASVSLWNAGVQKGLANLTPFSPVFPCPSRVRPDGSLLWTRAVRSAGVTKGFPTVHAGAVPGTDTRLGARGGTGSTACLGEDLLEADGTAGGGTAVPGGPSLATVWRGTRATALPLQPGETSSSVVAVAPGGRAIVVAFDAAGDQRLYAWNGATLRPLTMPAGRQLKQLVDYADSGLVVANLEPFGGGGVQPVVWQVPA